MFRAIPILLLVLISFYPVVEAAKLYKYLKPDGTVGFSDKPPASAEGQVEVRQLRVDRRQERFFVEVRGGSEQKRLQAINEYRGPVEVELSLADEENLDIRPTLPRRWIIPGCSEQELAALQGAQPGQPWSFRYRMRYVPGNPHAEHRPQRPYLVPFQSGRKFRISQGFQGKTSHNGPQNRFAVDISMPEGTPVRAARSGILMDAAFDFFEGGMDRQRYGARTNLVRILHDDGSMGVYAHLKLESVRFSLGARIEAGEIVALSGNTGYSSGPHLHFAVLLNRGMKLESTPFVFDDGRGGGVAPQQGTTLAAW